MGYPPPTQWSMSESSSFELKGEASAEEVQKQFVIPRGPVNASLSPIQNFYFIPSQTHARNTNHREGFGSDPNMPNSQLEAQRRPHNEIISTDLYFSFYSASQMITKNFEDYPEHRLKFFSLLRAIATHCFPALICLSSQQLKLVMDSIIWAFRHTERNIAETGLNLLLEMLKKFQGSEFCNQFYRTYFLTIEQEIFAVLTDTFHKPGFKLHVLVLQHLFCLLETGALTEPLWDAATNPYPYLSNAAFVREFTIKLLSTSFPNMTTAEVTQFVNGLFESTTDLSTFKTHIRDFLIQSKEFSTQVIAA
ncbi:protein EXPORTIN 1A-like [Lotus japonicus]|uniref:protein EXPORTIN 1A-like n=1 Tax=Lotus japonicus TaxID=34305 RepID=UPI00258FE517|nr:protein EXPORTIN 1A-like [Lotus japonicus]